MAHSHGSDADEAWRPPRQVRILVLLALVPFAVATVVGLVWLWPSGEKHPVPVQFTTYGEQGVSAYETGRVTATRSYGCTAVGSAVDPTTPTPAEGTCTDASVLIEHGPDAGRTVSITDSSGTLSFDRGDEVRVVRGPVDPATGQRTYDFDDYVRDLPLGLLAGFFALLLVGVARWRGLAAMAGVGFAYLVLVKFLLPSLLDGRSPAAVALVGAAAILFVVLYVAHGFSYRTTTALLGTLGALLLTGGLGTVATGLARLTGRSNEINTELQAAGLPISIHGLILCGLIVGALGVLNDVTITQASAVWELSEADPGAGVRELFAGGMRIGRDHIASTVYTLVFAYAGASLPLLLLFSVSGRSVHDLLTGDEIAGEIVRDLVGGIGLVLAVPLTTAVAALVASRPHEALPEYGEYGEDSEYDEDGENSEDQPLSSPR